MYGMEGFLCRIWHLLSSIGGSVMFVRQLSRDGGALPHEANVHVEPPKHAAEARACDDNEACTMGCCRSQRMTIRKLPDGRNVVYDQLHGQEVDLYCVHFSGQAKALLRMDWIQQNLNLPSNVEGFPVR